MYVQRHFTNISHACANNTSRSVLPFFAFLTHLRISTPPTFLWVSRQNEGGVESNGDRVLTFITPSDVMNATCTQPLECTFPFRRTSCIAVMLFTACIFVVMISDRYERSCTQPLFSQILPNLDYLPQGYELHIKCLHLSVTYYD